MPHEPDTTKPAQFTVNYGETLYLWVPCKCGDDQCWHELQATHRHFVGGTNVTEFPR